MVFDNVSAIFDTLSCYYCDIINYKTLYQVTVNKQMLNGHKFEHLAAGEASLDESSAITIIVELYLIFLKNIRKNKGILSNMQCVNVITLSRIIYRIIVAMKC